MFRFDLIFLYHVATFGAFNLTFCPNGLFLNHIYTNCVYFVLKEQINQLSYNEKSDIWSLGCLLYELCALS